MLYIGYIKISSKISEFYITTFAGGGGGVNHFIIFAKKAHDPV